MMPFDYHVASGIVLIAIGAALVCGALISRRREQTDLPDPRDADGGELRAFVDSLRGSEEATETNARPRIDRIHK
jgi:hypothetical protein